MGILTMHITTPPSPPSQVAAAHGRWIPPELEQVILYAMGKQPNERFQNMGELVNALQVVYRQYVGAGSTQPHSTQLPVSPSQFVPVATGHVAVQNVPMSTPPSGMGLGATVAPPGMMGRLGTAPTAMQPPPGSYPPGGYPPGMTPPGGMPPSMQSGMTPLPGVPGVATPAGGMTFAPTPAPRSNTGLIVGLVVLLLAGGGGAGWYFLFGPGKQQGGGAPIAQLEADAGPKGPAIVETVPDAKTDPVPEIKTPPPETKVDPPPTPAKPEKIKVLVDSVPRGAKIFDENGKYLGDTPVNVVVEKGKEQQLKLSKSGFDATIVTVDGSEEEIRQPLDRLGGGTGRPHHGSKDGKGKDDKTPPGGTTTTTPGGNTTTTTPGTGKNGPATTPPDDKPKNGKNGPKKDPTPGDDDSDELE
jgi:hypothetical protein